MLFLLSIIALCALITISASFSSPFCTTLTLSLSVAVRYRLTLAPYVPERVKSLFPIMGQYTPLRTFADQADAGLTSSEFDIEANMRNGDSRAGLDERGTQEVMDIMHRERVKYVHLLAFPSAH